MSAFSPWFGKTTPPPPEEDRATHSSVLAWRIPWTEERWATVLRVTKSDTTEAT